MSQSAVTPIEQARQLVAELQARAETIDPGTLKAELAKLANTLNASNPPGADHNAPQPELASRDVSISNALHSAASSIAPSRPAPTAQASDAPPQVQATQPQRQDEAAALRAEIAAMIERHASFNSLLVHEIRKPMTSIRGYSDMLAKPGLIGPLNEMQQQFVGIIRSNIINMEGLVSNISDLNKLISGRMQLENKMTTFGQVIMDVQKQIDPLAVEVGNTVTYEVPQGLPILIADAKQLSKVLVHLMRNAVNYTPKGGQITLHAEATADASLRVTITDTGVGMTPSELARLGEPFYRADDPLVTAYKGYGLGVPVAMRFLELMNSHLEFESEVGKGTKASFVLAGMKSGDNPA